MDRPILLAAGALGGLGVALGAFGAHALRAVLPLQAVTIFQTGVQYHLVHALALLATGVLAELWPREPRLPWVAWGFGAGIVLFSGSLYALALTDLWVFAWITPAGGTVWLVAWGVLAWCGAGGRRRPLRR
ncbi:MAG: DUF423 domain-containing protein [Candidatus Lambdaproteobacteria bacterium]|nr:DUF423 domain-containing protein [Candidatus Lambdaproteobacteria bacterium]